MSGTGNDIKAKDVRWGSFSFQLQVTPLASNAAFVRGAWKLTMKDGKTPHGLFTLLFRKFPDGWKIVHDHTSAE